jgi:hypothetical protein
LCGHTGGTIDAAASTAYENDAVDQHLGKLGKGNIDNVMASQASTMEEAFCNAKEVTEFGQDGI